MQLLHKIEEIDSNLKGYGFEVVNSVGFMYSAISPIFLAFLGEIETHLPYYFIMILIIPAFIIIKKFVEK